MKGRILTVLVLAAFLVAAPAASAPVQTPKRGGAVFVGPVREPACLAPFLATCTETPSPAIRWVLENVVPSAYVVDSDFTLRPRLVSSVVERGRTLTYRIRDEARWSDGVPVTTEDFAFTHQVIRRTASPDAVDLHLKIRSLRKIDAKTFRVVLSTPLAGWREGLFYNVLPRHALAGEDLARLWADGIVNPKTGAPIGSGPFLLENWDRGRQLTLVRNRRYWGPHPAYLDRIVLRFCRPSCFAPPADQVLSSLGQGDVDFAFSRDTGIVSDLRRIPGIRVIAAPTDAWEHLDLRMGPGGHPALQNRLVRRALAYGIDRVAVVRRLLREVDPKYPPSDSAVFLNSSRYYLPNWSGYRHRPALARRLLEQAGCRRGADSIYSCADRRLSLRFSAVPGQPLRERTLRLIETQLREVGIEAVVSFGGVDPPSGNFDAHLFHWTFGVEALYLHEVFGCGGVQNWTGYCRRSVTEEFHRADRLADLDERARVLNRADRQLARDVPVIPLFQVPLLYAFSTSLRGIDPAPWDPFWNAVDWWLDD